MPAVDIPGAKRAGLPVDLDRLTAEGDDWLSAEERYALKQHGVCAQWQEGVFMLRCRTDGTLSSEQARAMAAIAEARGHGWLHLTTRQQIELHHVAAREVTATIGEVGHAGLTTSSTCGHAVRGVMWCPDAGVGLDEPFDCRPDAEATTATMLARTPKLNHQLPQRLNIAFGGCPACREHARTNDLAFVSAVGADGELGYEVWAGGSLGKSAPTLGHRLREFVPRAEVLPLVNAVLDVFTALGPFDKPNKARLKFLIKKVGAGVFAEEVTKAFARRRAEDWPIPDPVTPPPEEDAAAAALACVPPGGWHAGVRPQREPGRALVTAHVPLGDLDADDLRGLADLADELADAELVLTRRQNVTLRHVAIEAVPAARDRLAALGLSLEGGAQAGDLRACTGGPVCALSITPAQEAAHALRDSPALARNSGLRVHVSGCQNACAQDQIADLGFTGGKVTVGGEATPGYQVWVGGDLRRDRLGEILGRVACADVPAVVEAVVGVWEALRLSGESLGETVERVGAEAVKAHIGAVFAGRWEPGPEPALADDASSPPGGEPGLAAGDGPLAPDGALAPDRTLPLAVAS